MKRTIACVLAADFEDSEFKVPYERLHAAGYEVEVIGITQDEKLVGKRGQESTTTTVAIEDVDPAAYMALLIPGGASPARLRQDERIVDFVRQFAETGKPIAAICHGPQLLIAAGVVKGRTMTGYSDIHAELRAAGATVQDAPMVADKNYITSRKPDDLPQFCDAMLTQFETNADQSWMARGDVHQAAT